MSSWTLWIGVGILAIFATGVVGWWLRDENGVDTMAVPVGHVSEFPVRSVTLRVLDVGFFDPFGVENPSGGSGGKVSEARLFVVHHPDAGFVALWERSPWLGCRVVEVSAAEAIEFGHMVPADFEHGFLDPCHGGLFALDGRHLAGPGERGLDRFPVRYLSDGSLAVDLTRLQMSASRQNAASTGAVEPLLGHRFRVVLLFSDGIDGVTAVEPDLRIAARSIIAGARAGDQPVA